MICAPASFNSAKATSTHAIAQVGWRGPFWIIYAVSPRDMAEVACAVRAVDIVEAIDAGDNTAAEAIFVFCHAELRRRVPRYVISVDIES